MGFDEDLGKAFDGAKSETAKLIAEQRNIAAEQAATSVPTRADCRVTQVVDIKKGGALSRSEEPGKYAADSAASDCGDRRLPRHDRARR